MPKAVQKWVGTNDYEKTAKVIDSIILGYREDFSTRVDFLFQHQDRVIPLEAKSEINTRAKSFALFCKRYAPQLGFKLSMKNVGLNFVESTPTYSLPLYLAWRLPSYLNPQP